jgi:hypothetical protein
VLMGLVSRKLIVSVSGNVAVIVRPTKPSPSDQTLKSDGINSFQF